ncbi:MAG: SMI1/KNR4 family protein [Chroococcus sp. CMT-3BRIN-NPC107]|nr:SMI1/KNR4 family protein [Chroococcus sp. CMT-3BRIN-NPC107]
MKSLVNSSKLWSILRQIVSIMNSLIACMQKLIDFRSEIGQPIDRHFLPGLSREYLQERISQYPFYFPKELIDLYTWHNGTKDEDFLIFRDMAWLSFENSVSDYESMLENYWSAFDRSEIGLEPAKMFPFAGFNGFYLYLSYPGQAMCPNAELPIIGAGEGEDPYFTSFDSMLNTVEEWFAVGEHKESGYEVEDNLEREIWQKHNFEIFGV